MMVIACNRLSKIDRGIFPGSILTNFRLLLGKNLDSTKSIKRSLVFLASLEVKESRYRGDGGLGPDHVLVVAQLRAGQRVEDGVPGRRSGNQGDRVIVARLGLQIKGTGNQGDGQGIKGTG